MTTYIISTQIVNGFLQIFTKMASNASITNYNLKDRIDTNFNMHCNNSQYNLLRTSQEGIVLIQRT